VSQQVNVISPTGCVHRAIDDRFSVPGSRRTLCNHTKPCVGLGWDAYSYHNWPDTTKPVTCKRCLKEIEPKVTARRHDIKWLDPDLVDKQVSAEVTVNSWYDPQGAVLTVPAKKEKFILYSGNYYTGMKGADGGTVPRMSEERRQWLHLVAQSYWSAIFNREMNYTWNPLD
jgi:hypothetical protein